ncbi:MAG TPA: Gfo/Idh/MocA family oxidoreductase [Bacteroidia bacterium]|nr:Gfo/Idh/MocA family oxidoreductase [Bacteroidia bacterium]
MLKIGVIGVGHLGKIHLRQIREIPAYTLVGFYDIDAEASKTVAAEFGIPAFPSMEELIKAADVVDVVVPTISHFDCAVAGIKQTKHVFIEKPLASTPAEAKTLVALANEANIKTQVGHVERFNPAFLAVKDKIDHPMFIEAHRLTQFNPRGMDVSVVLELMIHDIDIILSVVKSDVKRVSASGVPVISETPDIANARIEFDNGCVANLTASRISLKNMRKMRMFQKDAYISVDMLSHKSELIRVKDVDSAGEAGGQFSFVMDMGKDKKKKQVDIEQPVVNPNNAIRMELQAFADAILNNQPTRVTIEDGAKALEVAYKVIEKINFLQTN